MRTVVRVAATLDPGFFILGGLVRTL